MYRYRICNTVDIDLILIKPTIIFYFSSDIDECKIGKHKCSHYCVNTPGSYNCQCPDNHKLFADGIHCVLQIDESQPQHDYPQQLQQTHSPQFLQLVKYAAMVCPDGYFIQNEKCHGNCNIFTFLIH